MATNVNSIYSSSSRITGMFSELDTDALVKNLCSAQQTKIDTQNQRKTLTEWKKDALNDIADKVKTFNNTYCSVLGSSSMLKSSTYSQYKVSTTSTSNAVAVSASDGAYEGKTSVSVSRLAGSASTSSRGVSNGKELSSSNTTTLKELGFKTPLQFDSKGEISFSINGKKFSFSAETTLQNMINTINSDEDANVTMKYSRLTDGFSITSDVSGAEGSVSIVNISGNAFGNPGATMQVPVLGEDGQPVLDESGNPTYTTQPAVGAFGIASGKYTDGAQNALVTIDGIEIERDSNNFTIDGLTYELNEVTESTMHFNVTRDYSAASDNINEFVDSLNDLIKTLDKYVSTKKPKQEFKPLTDAQKEEMSEDEIEKWEAKAKEGILYHDKDLEKLLSDLKGAFYSPAGGTGKNLASIGITTASYFSSNKGTLELDADALKAAMSKDLDSVIKMFTGGKSTSPSSEQGLIYKFRNSMTNYLGVSNNVIKDYEKSISDIEKTVGTLTDKLSDMANKYYKKFANMETALSKLNSSANYLSQLFA